MLAFEGDSRVVWFEGNYAGLRGRPAPPARRRGRAAAPHPVPAAHARLIVDASDDDRAADATTAVYERTPPVWTGPGAPGRYFDLLHNLVTRAIKQRYKRSILGFAWTMLNPLLTMVILTRRLLGGLRDARAELPALRHHRAPRVEPASRSGSTQGLASVVDSGPLIRKVAVPKEMFPLAAVGGEPRELRVLAGAALLGDLVMRVPITAAMLWVPLRRVS